MQICLLIFSFFTARRRANWWQFASELEFLYRTKSFVICSSLVAQCSDDERRQVISGSCKSYSDIILFLFFSLINTLMIFLDHYLLRFQGTLNHHLHHRFAVTFYQCLGVGCAWVDRFPSSCAARGDFVISLGVENEQKDLKWFSSACWWVLLWMASTAKLVWVAGSSGVLRLLAP